MSKTLGSCSNRNKKKLTDLKGINLCGNYFLNLFSLILSVSHIKIY